MHLVDKNGTLPVCAVNIRDGNEALIPATQRGIHPIGDKMGQISSPWGAYRTKSHLVRLSRVVTFYSSHSPKSIRGPRR